MGIPSYFSYIVKNHLSVLKKLSRTNLHVNNLYMDCNSIIYDAVHKLNVSVITNNIGDEIISNVIATIRNYIALTNPTHNVFIAFDGVAPVAKLEQQRSRRFKTYYMNAISKNILKRPYMNAWDTTSITPGTQFMNKLNHLVKKAFLDPSKYNTQNIIFSGSDEIGEGEHKIFQYMREYPEKHGETMNTIIYGLDADLIMLSINHLRISPNIYLFRETPEFIKSINMELEPNENYLLDMAELANAIVLNMNNGENFTNEQQKNTLYDYILMCFMLGNDFMPHFPAINIRTGGIDKLLQAYKEVIGGTGKNLTDGSKIHWNNMRRFIQFLAANEHNYLKQEHKMRDKKERHKKVVKTPEDKLENFQNMPMFERTIEKYINPFNDDWQVRYYKALFDMDIDTERTKQVCINYLEGLEWTMKYYTKGCPDWKWCYHYNYPPLLTDLIHYIPVFDTEFVEDRPKNAVNELVQLCYVLPRTSLQFLPAELYKALIKEKLDWYDTDCEFQWAYCKYLWESHPDLPYIDINELEQFVRSNSGNICK
jgi:5'-3' exonuclease